MSSDTCIMATCYVFSIMLKCIPWFFLNILVGEKWVIFKISRGKVTNFQNWSGKSDKYILRWLNFSPPKLNSNLFSPIRYCNLTRKYCNLTRKCVNGRLTISNFLPTILFQLLLGVWIFEEGFYLPPHLFSIRCCRFHSHPQIVWQGRLRTT